MTKPISPDDIAEAKIGHIPEAVVAAFTGFIRLRFREDGISHVAGHWIVTEDGHATVAFPEVTNVSCPGPQLGMELRKLLGSPRLKRIIDRAITESNLAAFLPDFGGEQMNPLS
jgi:hypothetical protein